MAVPEGEESSKEADAESGGDAQMGGKAQKEGESAQDPLLGKRECPEFLKVEDLSMRHYWRLSTIMGMADILLDVDKYFTYMLLINRCGQLPFGLTLTPVSIVLLDWSEIVILFGLLYALVMALLMSSPMWWP